MMVVREEFRQLTPDQHGWTVPADQLQDYYVYFLRIEQDGRAMSGSRLYHAPEGAVQADALRCAARQRMFAEIVGAMAAS